MPEAAALTEAEQQQATALEAAFKDEGLEMPKFDAEGKVEKPTQQPASSAATEGNTPDSTPKPSTPAAAEPKEKPAELQKKTEIQGDQSKFAKDKARKDDSWKTLNAEKEAHRKQVEADRAEIQRERQQWEQQRTKASTKYTPEQYEQAGKEMAERAQSYELQAKGLEKEAEEFESNGSYAEAESRKARARELRNESIVQKAKAKETADYAKHLRDNPDPTEQQVKAKFEESKKEWTMKAATKYPSLAKEGSEFQKTVVGHLKALETEAPEFLESPKIILHVARLTAAEAEAARVPAMEKELGEAKARVKELELLTSPGGGDTAATRVTNEEPKFHELSLDQQEAVLEASWNNRR